MSWRRYADWAKERSLPLKVADFLGRGRGRFRVLDSIHPPPRPVLKPDLSNWQTYDLAALWIGHATVLLRIGRMNVIIDPVMSNRIGIGLGFITGGPRRYFAPALTVRQLPPLDLILSSHAHFDHLDRPTLCRLDKNIPVVAAAHTTDLLADLGFRHITELAWGESAHIGALNISAHRVKHWGARTFFDSHRGFNSYLLESDHRRILFGGDTAYGEHFKDIGQVDLAILGIGAYDPYIAVHATPEQAWEMANHVQAKFVLPMHHSTFRLSHEPMSEPLTRFIAAAGTHAGRIAATHIGEIWHI